MIEDMIIQSNKWPINWVLVLHDRYGQLPDFLAKLVDKNAHVFISKATINTPRELEKLICSADVGIGLYQSNFNSYYEGKNLVFLGLASGKLITYLKYGVPVITNEIGQLSDIIRDNNLGLVVSSVDKINLAEIDNIKDCRRNCMEYFEKHLSFNLKANQLLELISNSILRYNIDEKITSFNDSLDYDYSLSRLKQIEYYFNLAKYYENSKYYQLGYLLCNPYLLTKRREFVKFVKSMTKDLFHR
jgi:hypothetical protein